MSKIKVAIQGELGAYSHIAVERLYKDTEIKTCSTFEETFKQAFNDSNYKRLITNAGYFSNKNNKLNKLSKSTALHSTLIIEDFSSCTSKKINNSINFYIKECFI